MYHSQAQQHNQNPQPLQGAQGAAQQTSAQPALPQPSKSQPALPQPAQSQPIFQPTSQPALPQLFPLNQEGTLNQPSAPAFPGLAEILPPVDSLTEQLEKLMQNERNGAAYYEKLATAAEAGPQAEVLRGIGERCWERMRSYNTLYRKYNAVDFQTNENPIMSPRTMRQGLSLALSEEELIIKELINMYESVSDIETRHVLSAQLYKKLSDLGTLQRLEFRV